MTTPTRRSPHLAVWLFAAIALLLIGGSAVLLTQSASAVSEGGGTPIPPAVDALANHVVAPLLRAFGNPDPSPATVAAALRTGLWGALVLGVLILLVAIGSTRPRRSG